MVTGSCSCDVEDSCMFSIPIRVLESFRKLFVAKCFVFSKHKLDPVLLDGDVWESRPSNVPHTCN